MDKQPVGQLPDLTQSNNDDEIMVITDSEHNQLKKEKISDFITDLTSTDENNAIVKGTDGKLFTKDFGNASNITEGTLPVSVLPDIPKDKLPDIEITDLPESGVTADTYAYPSSVTVNAQGMVTAIAEGTPSGSNANVDLSNITEAGKKVIRKNSGGSGLPVGSIGMAIDVDETKGLQRILNGQVMDVNQNTQGFVNWLKQRIGYTQGQVPNVDIVGNVTNNNGVFSGFSPSNYALTDVVLPSSITSYEFVAKFTTGSNITTQQGVLANSATNRATPQINISDKNTIVFNHPVNSTTWATVTGLAPQTNTTYWVKATWDGTTVSVYYKTSEAAEYTLLGTDSATTIYWVEQIGIGIDTTKYPFSGSIDLNECYIKINGEMWWQGMKNAPVATLRPNLICTEEEWQAAKTASAFGQVGKFVIDDEAGTVRLPAVVNVQGLMDLQNTGLTVDQNTQGLKISAGSTTTVAGLPVQPEAIQYPYFIQIATGQETEVNILNQIELNNPYSLFDSKYSEASIYNLSWLLSNGTYYPKSIYTTAYEALLVEYNTEVMQGEAVELPSGGSYIKRGLPVVTMAPEVMTSTHTATSGWSNLENAFDNNASTYASCGTGTDYIEITFNSPVNVYEFTAAGNYKGGVARACNFAIYSVDEEGEETLLANSTGAAQTEKYTTSASLTGNTVSKLRLYLIAGPTGAPTTQYPTRITEIKIATAQAQTATDYDFVVNTTDETFKLPLKNGTEGMFGGAAVVGNGLDLGLYDGTAYNGLIYNTSSSLSGRANVYGSSVGQTGSGSSTLGNNAATGVTTDPAKSGLVTTTQAGVVPEGYNLYYYVGETVQNANLINATALAKNANRQLSNLINVGMSQYNIFSVNTGVVDADGEPAFLVETGNTIATSGTFTATTASGDIYTISQTLTYDKSLLPAGDYNIWIDPVEKQITLDQKVFTIGKKFPDDAADGDYLLNISQLPYKLQIFSSTGEPSESNKILCGTATVATA